MISGLRFDLRGAHHKWGVYPDLVVFGKSIANGFSFSLLAGRRDIMELGGLPAQEAQGLSALPDAQLRATGWQPAGPRSRSINASTPMRTFGHGAAARQRLPQLGRFRTRD